MGKWGNEVLLATEPPPSPCSPRPSTGPPAEHGVLCVREGPPWLLFAPGPGVPPREPQKLQEQDGGREPHVGGFCGREAGAAQRLPWGQGPGDFCSLQWTLLTRNVNKANFA